MPAYPVIGGQWGDEGKGKVVDFLSKDTDCIVRFAGGSNAGHTVINENGEFRLHLVPSGIFAPQASSIIGNGMVVDPDVLLQELEELASRGIDTRRLYVSERAHLIMPYHLLLDQLEEERRSQGAGEIGTTGRGVGPAYTDKTSRVGVRVGDLLDKDNLRPRLEQAMELKNRMITRVYDGEALSVDEVYDHCLTWREKLQSHITDTEGIIQDTLGKGGKVAVGRRPRHPPGLGPRHLPLCDVVMAFGWRRVHRHGCQPKLYPGNHRHFQGLLHKSGPRAYAYGDAGRH